MLPDDRMWDPRQLEPEEKLWTQSPHQGLTSGCSDDDKHDGDDDDDEDDDDDNDGEDGNDNDGDDGEVEHNKESLSTQSPPEGLTSGCSDDDNHDDDD